MQLSIELFVALDLSEDSREFLDTAGMSAYFLCNICCTQTVLIVLLVITLTTEYAE